MKPLKFISALLLVASTLLSSCSLLVSSPLPPSRPHPHSAAYGPGPYGGASRLKNKVYNKSFQVSAKGGIYEFECANDQFYISKIYDSSMSDWRSDSRYSPPANSFRLVNDLTYCGPFYTITCDNDNQKWIMKVDPLMTTSDESDERAIWVLMWDESDHSNFVFQFEQSGFDYSELIH